MASAATAIIDASALVAFLLEEPERDDILAALSEVATPAIGAPSRLEAELVLCGSMGERGREPVRRFIRGFGVAELPFAAEHRRAATDAFLRYGKGRHPAGLNFGDCMTYAMAKLAGQPLLCIGEDFAATDLDLVPLAN